MTHSIRFHLQHLERGNSFQKERWKIVKEANLLQLLPIEFHYICFSRRPYVSVIEFVIMLCSSISPDPSWRSTTAEIRKKMCWIFPSIHLHNFLHLHKVPFTSIKIAEVYQG